MSDDNTYLSDAHVRVIKWLEAAGVNLLEEVEFPPYRVDIYVHKHHAAIEVDGPQHAAKADRERDNDLWYTYMLPVLRVSTEDRREALVNRVLRWLEAHDEGDVRYELVKDKVPWI